MPSGPGPGARTRRSNSGFLVPLFFLAPAMVCLAIFQFLPVLTAVRNSFFNINMLAPDRASFAGLGNFTTMLSDGEFARSLQNTLAYTVAKLAIQIPLSLGLALLVDRGLRGTRLVRSAIFAPTVTAVAIAAVIWNLMLQPDQGLINSALRTIGLPGQPFLTSATQSLPSLVAMGIWQETGLTTIIFLSGLQGIPRELQDAARIDGASSWQGLRFVTIPLLARTVLFAVILTTVLAFKVFAEIQIMTQGGPQDSTLMAVYYLYREAFIFLRLGYASALAIAVMAILAVIAALQARVLRARFEY